MDISLVIDRIISKGLIQEWNALSLFSLYWHPDDVWISESLLGLKWPKDRRPTTSTST